MRLSIVLFSRTHTHRTRRSLVVSRQRLAPTRTWSSDRCDSLTSTMHKYSVTRWQNARAGEIHRLPPLKSVITTVTCGHNTRPCHLSLSTTTRGRKLRSKSMSTNRFCRKPFAAALCACRGGKRRRECAESFLTAFVCCCQERVIVLSAKRSCMSKPEKSVAIGRLARSLHLMYVYILYASSSSGGSVDYRRRRPIGAFVRSRVRERRAHF